MTGNASQPRSLCIDPLNPCAPIGAMYAAFGVHGGLPLSHGASGCCRFQRMELAKHFQKTVHVPSTLLRDRAAMFGGEPEVVEAVENVFRLYDPEVLVISTTCLSETIGDDMGGIADRLEVPKNKSVVWVSTPGYAGSQLAGYGATVAALIRQLGGSASSVAATSSAPAAASARRLCMLPGWLNPCDVDVAVGYAEAFFDEVTVLPDARGVFDYKTPDDPSRYAPGGTPRTEIERVSQCSCGLALGYEATAESACALRGVAPAATVAELSLPLGITATDRMIAALVDLSGREAPSWIVRERKQVTDCLMQVADQLYGKRILVCCDADQAAAAASFAVDAGMVPSCIAVGDTTAGFEDRLRSEVALPKDCTVLAGVDRQTVEEHVASNPVALVLGDTRNKRLAAREGVPLVRIGFPVVDRPLSYTEPIAGYRGALALLRRIACALADAGERGMAPEDLSISRYF